MNRLCIALLTTLLGACSAAGQVTGVTTGTTGIPFGSNGSLTSTASGTAGTSSGGGSGSSNGSSSGSTTGGVVCPGSDVACGGTCCPTGFGCVGTSCCEVPCNTQKPGQMAQLVCCPSAQECITLGDGVTTECAQTCADSSRCPSTSPCCTPVMGGKAACVPGDPNSNACICVTGSQCASGCCAPALSSNGQPVGPYVCKPNDGLDYDCCSGIGNSCVGNGCCIKDGLGNEFCAVACMMDGGPNVCGAARCQNYAFSALTTTCNGPSACGPH